MVSTYYFENQIYLDMIPNIPSSNRWVSMPLLNATQLFKEGNVVPGGSLPKIYITDKADHYQEPCEHCQCVSLTGSDTNHKCQQNNSLLHIKVKSTQTEIRSRKSIKNLLVLSFGWMLFFMSFSSLRDIQSSINQSDGLGLYSLACVYAGYVFACGFTTAIVKRLTSKWTLVFALICQIIYAGINIKPEYYTLLPASLLCGFSQAAMWTAMGTYIMQSVSEDVPEEQKENVTSTVSKYFGIFFLFCFLSTIFGSLVISGVLSIDVDSKAESNFSVRSIENSTVSHQWDGPQSKAPPLHTGDAGSTVRIPELFDPSGHEMTTNVLSKSTSVFNQHIQSTDGSGIRRHHEKTTRQPHHGFQSIHNANIHPLVQTIKPPSAHFNESNSHLQIEKGMYSHCGAEFSHTEVTKTKHLELSPTMRPILTGTFVGSMIISLMCFVLFLDSSRPFVPSLVCSSDESLCQQITAVFLLFRKREMMLISPLIFYHGMQTAFLSGDITKGFIGCVFGLKMIGFVMAASGLCAAIGSLLSGFLGRHIRQTFILATGVALNLITLMSMLLWRPSKSDLPHIFILCGSWSVANGIWATHVNGIVGMMFPEETEAAYSACQLIMAAGLVFTYGYAHYVYMSVKIYITGAVCIIAIACYVILERCSRSETSKYTESSNQEA